MMYKKYCFGLLIHSHTKSGRIRNRLGAGRGDTHSTQSWPELLCGFPSALLLIVNISSCWMPDPLHARLCKPEDETEERKKGEKKRKNRAERWFASRFGVGVGGMME